MILKHKLFDESIYLENNPDIVKALSQGHFQSAWDHYITFGFSESRKGILPEVESDVKRQIVDRVRILYKDFHVPELSYATVRDYADSRNNLSNLIYQGDMKDVARPWALKAILSKVPKGSRILEIGAGEPILGQFLCDLGYDVTIVDPYDGSGNGPLDYELFKEKYPNLRFIRALFSGKMNQLRNHEFDCIFSVSVLEHISLKGLTTVFDGVGRYLKKSGYSIHTIDFIAQGKDDVFSQRHLEKALNENHIECRTDQYIRQILADVDTYYLSANAHLKWKGNKSYAEYPYRKVTSVHICKQL